jgi:hypothetical protein
MDSRFEGSGCVKATTVVATPDGIESQCKVVVSWTYPNISGADGSETRREGIAGSP